MGTANIQIIVFYILIALLHSKLIIISLPMELFRSDYFISGPTNASCMKLLPLSPNSKFTQKVRVLNEIERVINGNEKLSVTFPMHSFLKLKIVVGDENGILQIFFIKRNQAQIIFKSLPASCPIKNVVLGGSLGSLQDKIFISCGIEISGYTKRGKMFLHFESQFLEPIKKLYICGNDFLACSDYNFHHYYDCKLSNSYSCGELIYDVIGLNVAKVRDMAKIYIIDKKRIRNILMESEKENKYYTLPACDVRRLLAILACGDRVLRVLDGSSLVQTWPLRNTPISLIMYANDGGVNGDLVLVGMQEGQIALVQIMRDGNIFVKWIMEEKETSACVTCIMCYTQKMGETNIVVGREDGNIDIYAVLHIPEEDGSTLCLPPIKKYSYPGNDRITSIQGGYVRNLNYEEILATTYKGWIFGLTKEDLSKTNIWTYNENLKHGQSSDSVLQAEEKEQISKLRFEVNEMQEELMRKRGRDAEMAYGDSATISKLKPFHIKDKMFLVGEEANYVIMLETETDIDNVLVQCNIPITILDADKNTAVISYSKCENENDNFLLATYRCQTNTTKLRIKFFSKEGDKGLVNVYITLQCHEKLCQLRKYQIKPLSLHTRVHDIKAAADYKFYNVLQLKGVFSLAEIHRWITLCLPDIPEKRSNELNYGKYIFKSVLTNTILICSYSKGVAEFKSDSISTIAILKENLTKEATKKKIKLDISTTVCKESILDALTLMHPKMEKYSKLEQNVAMEAALKDIIKEDGLSIADISILSPEYARILNKYQQEANYSINQRPFYLKRLHESIMALFNDWNKSRNVHSKTTSSTLFNSLKNYRNVHDVYSYFNDEI